MIQDNNNIDKNTPDGRDIMLKPPLNWFPTLHPWSGLSQNAFYRWARYQNRWGCANMPKAPVGGVA